MAEKNKPVKIYLAYSEKDKISNTARQNMRDITAYLEKPDDNGDSYAKILNPFLVPKENSREIGTGENTESKQVSNSHQKLNRKIHLVLFCKKVYKLCCALYAYITEFSIEKVWRKFIEKLYGFWYLFGREKRKIKKRQDIQRADIILLLYSDNIKEKDNAISWVIRTAQKANRNVVICSLDKTKEVDVPGWLKKIDDRIKPCTWDGLREKIEYHVEKKYKVFRDSEGHSTAEPCANDIGPKMIEQYQTYMQSIEHQENARQTANNAYITANSAFLALLGVILDKEHFFTVQNVVIMFAVSMVGLRFYGAWTRTLDYYAQINTAKQRIVNHLERYLPLQLNSTEYYDAMQSPFEKRYKRFKESQALPKSFLFVWRACLALAVYMLIRLIFSNSLEVPDITIKII